MSSKNLNTNENLQRFPSSSTSGLIDITFKDLKYSIMVKNEKDTESKLCKSKLQKIIINHISGISKGGQMTAIMGPSGSGKTTLLNILSRRITDNVEGEVFANGQQFSPQQFGKFANYVLQNDILFQTLTVQETLQFAAELKMNDDEEIKKSRILELINKMKLEKCTDVLVGGPKIKGVSGGQKKRTSIAFELISDPIVIMLDEPTSGLDSLTAFIITKYLKQLANVRGKTVLMTIHQPNSQIFNSFDRVLFLLEGKIAYQGKPKDSIAYFEKIGYKCSQISNPSDFIMDVIHPESSKGGWNLEYFDSKYKQILAAPVEQEIQSKNLQKLPVISSEISECTKLKTLLWRDILNLKRNPLILYSRLIQAVFIGLIVGGLFFGVNDDFSNVTVNSASFRSLIGALFLIAINSMIGSLSPVLLTFPSQREVFLKESGSRLYGVVPYFLSRNIVQFPYLIVSPIITALIMYWMIGLTSTVEQFFLFCLILVLTYISGASLGLLVGSCFSDPQVASAVAPSVFVPFFLVGGLFKNTSDLPDWIAWLQYISPIKYSYLAFARNELQARPSPLQSLGFDLELWPAIIVLIALSIAYRLLSLILLKVLQSKLN